MLIVVIPILASMEAVKMVSTDTTVLVITVTLESIAKVSMVPNHHKTFYYTFPQAGLKLHF